MYTDGYDVLLYNIIVLYSKASYKNEAWRRRKSQTLGNILDFLLRFHEFRNDILYKCFFASFLSGDAPLCLGYWPEAHSWVVLAIICSVLCHFLLFYPLLSVMCPVASMLSSGT